MQDENIFTLQFGLISLDSHLKNNISNGKTSIFMCPEVKFPMSQAVRNAYAEGQEDETLLPLVLVNHQNEPLGRIHPDDSVIFYNIRGEREIELTRSFTEKTFREFPVHQTLTVNFATMIEYQKGLNVEVAFPPQGVLCDTLSDIIAAHGLTQAKITEAEKAAHVSFFSTARKVICCLMKKESSSRHVKTSSCLMKPRKCPLKK